eukprot:gene13038-14302_t
MTNQCYYYVILLCLNIIIVTAFQPIHNHAIGRLLYRDGSFPPPFLQTTRLRSLKQEDSPYTPPSTTQTNKKQKKLRKLTQLQNRELLLSKLKEKGCRLTFPEEDLPLDPPLKTSLSIICERNHTFTSTLNFLISSKYGCPICRKRVNVRHPEEELQKVAHWFNGTFLGFVNNSSSEIPLLPLRNRLLSENNTKPTQESIILRDAHWRCSEGHEFITTVRKIRDSPPVQERKYSICPICKSKLRRRFAWNPIKIRWDLIEKDPVPRISKKLLLAKEKLDHYLIEKKGKIYSNATTEELLSDGWESKIPLICHNHHVWNSTVKTVLSKKTWCKRCAMENTQMIRLKNSEKLLNLQFLNLLKTDEGNNMINGDNNEDGKPLPLSLSLANWSCSNGHTFSSTLQSLTRVARRNQGVSCPVCVAAKEKEEERSTQMIRLKNSETLLNLQFLNLIETEEDNKDNNEDSKPLPLSLSLANWSCSNGHTFPSTLQTLTRVARRNQGVSCPVCVAAKEKAEERREKAVAVDNENSDNAMVTLQSSGGFFPPRFPRQTARLKSLNNKNGFTLTPPKATQPNKKQKKLRKLTQLQNRELLLSVLQEKGCRLTFPEEDLPLDPPLKTSLSIICERNHTFTSTLNFLISSKYGCPICRKRVNVRHPEEELQKVAHWFNGTFLGFVNNSSSEIPLLPLRNRLLSENNTKPTQESIILRDAHWRCSEGHEFITTVRKIRDSPPVQERKYSICPICKSKLRRRFAWNPIKIRWDLIEKDPVPRISKKLLLAKEKLDHYLIEKKGKIYSNATTEELLSDGWESKIPLICHNHHVWNSTVKTVLSKKTWCKRCAMENTQMIRLKNSEKLLNLQFLNLLKTDEGNNMINGDNNEDGKPLPLSLSLANWSCSNGHTFSSTLQSLTRVARRNQGVSCPVCVAAKEKEEERSTQMIRLKNSETLLNLQFLNLIETEEDNKDNNEDSKPLPLSLSLANWSCSNGHTFPSTLQTLTRVARRNQGVSCPVCVAAKEKAEERREKAVAVDNENSDNAMVTLQSSGGSFPPLFPRRLKSLNKKDSPTLPSLPSTMQVNNKKQLRKLTQLQNRELLLSVLQEKGGRLSFPEEDLPLDLQVKSSLSIICEKNHTFISKIRNLIYHDNWCPTCRNRGSYSRNPQEELQKVANWFNGTFLGFIGNINTTTTLLPLRRRSIKDNEKSYRQSTIFQDGLWRCSEGHEFITNVHNIRNNPPLQKRNYSLCSTCRYQLRRTFKWNPIEKRWDRGEATVPRISKKLLAFKEKLDSYVIEKRGKIYSNATTEELLSDGWESKIPLICHNHHVWKASVKTILASQTWCKRCAMENTQMIRLKNSEKLLNVQLLHFTETNKDNNGDSKPLSPSLSLANWSCSNGHTFQSTLQSLTRVAKLNHGISCP